MEFLKNFNFMKNVGLTITFQHFEEDWNEFVDLDDDAIVQHKDKLKVIVSPSLTDHSRSSTEIVTEVCLVLSYDTHYTSKT